MIKKCDKGHFYDDAKSEECPLCQNDSKTPHKKEISKTDEPKETTTTNKTPLSGSVCFYSSFVDGFTGDGKRAGGSQALTYTKNKNKVELIGSFHSEKGTGEDESLSVPKDIKYLEDLIEYIIDKKPDWKFYTDKYLSEKTPPQKDMHTKASEFSISAYDSIRHDIRPDYYEKTFSNKEPVFGVLELSLSIGIVICIILIIFIIAILF